MVRGGGSGEGGEGGALRTLTCVLVCVGYGPRAAIAAKLYSDSDSHRTPGVRTGQPTHHLGTVCVIRFLPEVRFYVYVHFTEWYNGTAPQAYAPPHAHGANE